MEIGWRRPTLFLAGWDSSNLQHHANCIVVELLYNWRSVGRDWGGGGGGGGGEVSALQHRAVQGKRPVFVCVCVNKLK